MIFLQSLNALIWHCTCVLNMFLAVIGSMFSVSSTTGEVTLLGALDREATRRHVITIQVS
jgi:hypothetical protein